MEEMKLASKIILHSPISDERLLSDFVEQCLTDSVSLLAIVGPGCERLEDIVDDIVVGDGQRSGRFLATTAHPDETLEEVKNLLELSEGPFQDIRL